MQKGSAGAAPVPILETSFRGERAGADQARLLCCFPDAVARREGGPTSRFHNLIVGRSHAFLRAVEVLAEPDGSMGRW